MPETARYTALVARNAKQAAADMSKVLHAEIEERPEVVESQVVAGETWGLFSRQFMKRHGMHLLATTSTWFLSTSPSTARTCSRRTSSARSGGYRRRRP
jgi:PHS family inorganic phosphate transporter-like MFS transporter